MLCIYSCLVSLTHAFRLAADDGSDSASKSALSGANLAGGPVDSALSFTLTLKDRFDNALTNTTLTCDDFVFAITLGSPSAVATPSCSAGSGASFELTWTTTVSGSWTIAVTAKAGTLSLQQTSVLTPLVLDGAKSMYDAGITPVAGEDGNLDILVKDKFSNALTAAGATFVATVSSFRALDGGASSVPVLNLETASFNGGGRYAMTYSATRSGIYSVTVTESGSTIGPGPFEIKIEPTKFWAPAMSASMSGDGATQAAAGHEASFDVKGVDKYGNKYSQGAVAFSAAITADSDGASIPSTVSAGTDGSSTCSYTITATGTYAVAITLTDGGQFDPTGSNSPNALAVTATAEETRTTSSFKFLSDTASMTGTAGVSKVVRVQEVDEFGNLRTISDESFTIMLSGPYMYSVNVSDQSDGKYDLTLAPTISGTYSVSVRADSASGKQLTTTAFSLLVKPAEPHHSGTILQNFGDYNQPSAGSVKLASNKFAVRSSDQYANFLTVGGYVAKFSVVLTSCEAPNVACHSSYPAQAGSKVVLPTLTDLENGYYGVDYSTTVSGYYSVAITCDGSYIFNSPSELYVEAGTTVASSSYAVTESSTCSSVLKTSEINDVAACTVASNITSSNFGVRLVDDYGNTRYRYSPVDQTKFSIVSTSVLFNEFPPSGALTLETDKFGLQLESGLHQISFIATVCGKYVSTIEHLSIADDVTTNNGAIKSSPVAVFVKPADAYAPYSYAEGFGLTVATAGIQSAFFMTTRDIYMNTRVGVESAVGKESGWTVHVKMTAEMYQSAGYQKDGVVIGEADGKFSVEYSATKAGDYTLYVRQDGKSLSADIPVSGSPFNAIMYPNVPAGPSFVTTDGVLQGRVVVSPVRVNIRSVDMYGNLNTRGNYGEYNSTITKLPLTVIDHIDHNNGSYVLQYRVTKTGTYVVDVSVRGEAIVGSPVTMIVTSGPAVHESSEVESPVTFATAGITYGFPVLSKDEYYNIREDGGDPFKVKCLNGNDQILMGAAFDLNNGSYTGMCYMTRSGQYQISVTILDYRTNVEEHISGSPFSIQVWAHVADPKSSGAFGAALTLASAGEWSTFKIFARDRFHNPNTGAGGNSFHLVVRPADGLVFLQPVPVCPSRIPTPQWGEVTAVPEGVTGGPCANGTATSVDIGGGTFVISYMWTITGSYGLEVSIVTADGVSYLADSPFEMTLKPGITEITRSDASGSAYTIATAGESMTFLIKTRDRFGNERSTSGGNFTTQLIGYPPLTSQYTPTALDLDNGKFQIEYFATASGKYLINIFNDKRTLKNAPSNITIYPAVSEPTTFAATGGGISRGQVGDDAPIYQVVHVQAKDRFYNIKTLGADAYDSKLIGGWMVASDGSTSPSRTITTTVQYEADGSYKIMYATTKSGEYQLNLKVRHPLTGAFLHVQDSPFSVHVSSGAISEISPFVSVETGVIVQLSVPGALNVATAGRNNFFLVIAKDKYQNPRTEGGSIEQFDLRMLWAGKWGKVGENLPPMNMTLPCQVTYVGDNISPGDDPRIPIFPGQYRVIYPATVSGLYRLIATFNSKPMVGHLVGIQPDGNVPSLSSAFFPPSDVNGEMRPRHTTAGVRNFFTVFSRDRFHNLRTEGGDEVTVDISGGRNSDAVIHGNITDSKSATALRAPMDPEDRAALIEGSDFGIERKRVVCRRSCVVDNGDGTYHVYLNPTISGQYRVEVFIRSQRICQTGCGDDLQNPYTFMAVANKFYPPLSVATGEGLVVATAGQDAEFVLQARDIFGNNRVHGRYTGNLGVFGGEFFTSYIKVNGALMTPDKCSCQEGLCTDCEPWACSLGNIPKCSKPVMGYPKVSDNQDGTYTVRYKVTHSSHYSLAVDVNGLQVLGSPFQPLVKPHFTDPATCIATGDSLYRTNAGGKGVATIQAKDEFGNKKTKGGDPVIINIIHTNYPEQCQRAFPTAKECIRCTYRETDCNLFGLVEGEKKPLNLFSNWTDEGTGVYSFHYVATVAGQYKLHIRMKHTVKNEAVDIGQRTIFRSPFPLTCSPDVLDPESSTVSGEGVELATVNIETQFLLWPRDRFFNVIVGTKDDTSVALCGVGSDCTPALGKTFIKLSFYNYDNSKTYQAQEKYSRGIVKLETGVPIKAVARPNGDGSTAISYTMTEIGDYRVILDVLDTTSSLSPLPYVPIDGSPFNMSVYPDDTDPFPEKCKVEMVERVNAGTRGSATVWLKNQYGISLSRSAKLAQVEIVEILGNPSKLEFRKMNMRDGSFVLNFSPTRSGVYSFSIRAIDADNVYVDVAGSPKTVTVVPADTDPKTCLAFVTNIDRLIAGSMLSYTMQSRDKFGNDADPNALKNFDMYKSYLVLSTDATQTRINGVIKSPRATIYTSSFVNEGDSVLTRSGQYKLYSTNLDVDVVNSPYVFNVIPAQLAPAVAVVDSSATATCTAGIFSAVRIQAKDQFGNVRMDGGDENFVVVRNDTFSPTGAFSFKAQYLIEGKTDALFRAEKAGIYVVHVLQAGIELMGSPFNTEVLPAVANAKASHNSTVIPSLGLAGQKLSFSIQAVDEFGNFHRAGGTQFDVVLKGLAYLRTYIGTRLCAEMTTDVTSCVTITDQENGVYLVEFTPTTAGDYIMAGSLMYSDGSKEAIGQPGSPQASPWTRCVSCLNDFFPDRECIKCRTLLVNPAIVNVDTSTILGQSSEIFASGEEEEFLIYARDAFGNIQTDGGLDVVATVQQLAGPFTNINTTVHDLCLVAASKCGQYSVGYMGTQSGLYMLTVSINGNASTTPQLIRGYSAPTADPRQSGLPYIDNDGVTCQDICSDGKCCLLGETVSFGLTGLDMTFEIVARDRFGNIMTRGGESFTLDISGPMMVSGLVEDLKSGRYIAKYKVFLKGVYVVALRLRGIHVGKMVDECSEIFEQCFTGSPAFGLQITNPGTGLEGLKLSGDLPPYIAEAVAGKEGRFIVDATDETAKKKFELMPLTVAMQPAKGGPVTTPASQLADDVYTVGYMVPTSGLWKLSVMAGGQVHCVGSPFSVTVVPADAVPSQTLVTGSGHVETLIPTSSTDVKMAAIKGTPFQIYIIPRDVFFNERVQLTLVDDVRYYTYKTGESEFVKISAVRQIAGDHEGQYVALFKASESGTNGLFKLMVFVSGVVTGTASPVDVYDSAAAVSKMTVAHGAGLSSGVAGATVTFSIYARDASGCQLSTGGASIRVSIDDGEQYTTIIPNQDVPGTYQSRHVFNSVGTYTMEILVEGQQITQNTGTFMCVITPGETAPVKTELVRAEPWMRMNGIDSAQTAEMSDFQLLLKDEYGNRITEGIDINQISVTVSGPSYAVLNVVNRYCTDVTKDRVDACGSFGSAWHDNDGSYLVSYATTAAGRYTVGVSVQGTPVLGSPFIRQVEPNVPSQSTSYANGLALSSGNAGVQGAFALVLFDSFGNAVENKAMTNVTLDTVDSERSIMGRAVQMSSGSEYEGYYTATNSGEYSLTVLVNGFNVKGSPFSVTILPGNTYYEKCIASGPGLQSVVAGSVATFTIVARDKYGNDRTQGGDDFKTNLAGQELATGALVDYQNGTYTSSFTLTLAGDYTLISSLGVDQFLYRYPVPCEAAAFSGTATELMKRIPSEMEAGMCRTPKGEKWCSLDVIPSCPGCEFFFQARDRYGSKIRHCRDVPQITVVSESTLAGETILYNGTAIDIQTGETNCQNGYFTGSLARYFGFPDPNTCRGPCNGNAGTTRAGTYAISIVINGLPIYGSPFRTVVSAADSFPQQCVVDAIHIVVGGRSAQRDSTAGVEESFTIQSRDLYGNNVLYDPFKPLDVFIAILQTLGKSCDFDGNPVDEGAVCLKANIKNNFDSTHTVSYVPYTSGKYELQTVLVKGNARNQISNSPFRSAIQSNVVSVARSVVSGVMMSWDKGKMSANTTADAFSSFALIARDNFGNVVTNSNMNFEAYATRRGTIPGDLNSYRTDLSVLNNNDGTYEVSFTITASAKYTLAIENGGFQIKHSPFELVVYPSALAPGECTCEGGGFMGGMIEEIVTYNIFARDIWGNQLTSGGLKWSVNIFTPTDVARGAEVASKQPIPIDNSDGTYTVKYMSVETGKHRIMTYVVQDGMEREISDFFNDQVVFVRDDGYSVPGLTIAFGPGIKGGRAGALLQFTTQVRNELGLNRPVGGITLSTRLEFLLDENLKIPVDTMDINDGTYQSSFMSQKSGVFLLHVKMSNDHIQGSPFTLTIWPGETSALTSSLRTDRSLVSIVAETVTFKIVSRDAFYNSQENDPYVGPDLYVVRLSMDSGESFLADVINNEDGTYQASYMTTRAGAYIMYVTLKGEAVENRDDVIVSPGSTVTENCEVTGSGIREMEAGQVGYVQMNSRDFYGNLVQSGMDRFNVTLMKEGGDQRWLGYAQHCDPSCLARTSCPCMELKPGLYVVSYQVTTAASYKISVELNQNLLPSFPRDVVVTPSMVDTTSVSVVGCESVCMCSGAQCAPCSCHVMNRMQAGLISTFTLDSRDRFGNKVTSGGKSFRAVMAKAIPAGKTGCFISDGCKPATVEGEVNDNKDGTYLITLAGSVLGDYVLNVTRGGVSIKGAPFAFSIAPGSASSAPDGSSFALDPISTAGNVKTFRIQSRDMFGNQLSVGGEQFVMQLIGTSAAFKNMVVLGEVSDDNDGSYFSYFITEKAGLYDAVVRLDGLQIDPGRAPIIVFPAAVDPSTSSVSGTGLDVMQSAGDAAVDSRYIAPEIRVVARDRYGNVYSFDGLHIEAISSGPTVVTRSTRDKKSSKYIECGAGCGQYLIYNPLTLSGSYSINVLLYEDGTGQSLLAGGPVVIQLDSSAADSSKCTYDGSDGSQARTCTTDKVCTFDIQSVDYFGNSVEQRGDTFDAKLNYVTTKPVSTVFVGASSELRNAGGGIVPGKYVISYSVTASGTYKMQISRYGLSISDSPSTVEISAGVPVASACTTKPVVANDGMGMLGGLMGEELSFTVYARDQYGNVAKFPSIRDGLAVKVDNSLASSSVLPLSGGRYSVKYTSTRSGEHDMTVEVAGEHIAGSPFKVQITDVALAGANFRFSTIQDGPYLISTVNKVSTIPMTIRNNVGRDTPTEGARFEASLQGVLCGRCTEDPVVAGTLIDYACCVDNSVDPPTISYYSMKAGLASLSVSMVQLELSPIFGSPFELQILPDITDAKSSSLQEISTSDGFIQCTAGLSNRHVIVARDAYSNQQIYKEGAKSDIAIVFSGPSTVSTTLLDGSDGTFAMFYKVTRAGDYSMSVRIRETHISGSPFSVRMQPDNLFTRASTSEFSTWKMADSGQLVGKYVGTAGQLNTVVVQSRDAFGNVLVGSKAAFSMSIMQDITFTRTLNDQGRGLYGAEWDLKKSGSYFGAIFGVLGGCTNVETCANVRGSPFSVEILPDRIDSEKCRVYGAGSAYSVANENAVLFIIARDRFGNDVVSEDFIEYFEMKVTSASTLSQGFFEYNARGAQPLVLKAQIDGLSTAGIKTIYKAMMPGHYEIDVKYNGTRIGGTSGALCGPDKPCPMVARASSPVSVKAQFSDSGGHIYIDFDQQTNKANVTGDFSCDLLFATSTVAVLAANPSDSKCRFLSSTRLDAELGFGATILVNEDLVWKPSVLRRRPVCSSPQICYDYSFGIEGKVRVKRPNNPVTPTAILKAPASIGPCDNAVLDASASYGSAGRQLQYFFGLMPGTKNDKEVRNFILAKVVKPYTLSSVEVPKHLLMVGEVYQFVVKVSNFLDSSHSDMIAVKKVSESGPAVFVEGPNVANVRSSQSIKLRGSAELSACNVGSQDIDWMWSVTSTVPSSKLLTLNEQTKDTRNLYVPENSLVPGYSYWFTLTGMMRSNASNVGTATVELNCIFAPVMARISGGDQAVSMNRDLTLDASGSIDFDGDKAVGNFNYKWSCQNEAGKECFDDPEGLLLRDSATLEIAQGMLVPGVYSFGVTVSKEPGPRTESTFVTVYVMPTAQMPVSVLPLAKAKVNANDRLVLDAIYETGCGGNTPPDLEWSQSAGDHVLQYPSMISTPVTLRGLAFKPDILVPGATYRFRLTARCPKTSRGPITAPTGFGEIDVKINVAPSSGQMMVTPIVGRGTEDSFTMKMVNWVDDPEDLPFKYEFRYTTEKSPTDQIPLGSVDVNYIEARLPGPAKDPAPSHKIVLYAFVVDQYAASTKSEFTVTVLRTNSTGSSRRLLEFSASLLDQHVATGNVEGIIQMTISLSNEEGMSCSAEESMIGKLKDAASKVVMNKAEVAGFAYAVKSAMGGDCVAGGGRRLLSDSATENALELTGSLVGNSMSAGLDPTAERGMGDTLSSSLGSISTKNTARRSLRRLLSMDMYMQQGAPSTPPFFRGHEGREFVLPRKISEGQYHLLGEDSASADGPGQKAGDMLMGARDSLMGSQLNGALTGEDSKGVDTEKIVMSAQQRTPEELAGAKLGTGSSSFATPAGMFPPDAGSDIQAKSSNLADSPFDSDNEVSNVAGLSMGVPINDLEDPIELEMPSSSAAKFAGSGPPMQYQCVDKDGIVTEQKYWTLNDCVVGCSNSTKLTDAICVEMPNDSCQKDDWDSCVQGEVDTCRFWNSKLNDWDGEGCIVQGSVANGGVMCHCYHLTDFGGAGNDVMPKMNVPDPTNPGAAFKNIGADKILVIAILCLFLLMYWGLFYWGWRQDRLDNERMDSMEESLSKAQERKARNAEQDEALVQGNNFRLLQKAMNGKMSKSMMMIRNTAVKLFQGQHKLFSAFYAKRHHYTRPRRFTVLFVMLIGNMMVNGFFCGNEKASFVAKIIMGLIASMIMVPATLFFKFIFMTLDVDPKTRARWERETMEKTAKRKQEMAMTMTTGPTADGISAPPPHLRGVVPPRKIVRGYVPNPDHSRMGVTSRMNTFATRFKRRWTSTANQEAAVNEKVDKTRDDGSRPLTPVSVGHASSTRSVSSRSSGSGEFQRQQEVGAYLPRRALPMRTSPRPPAPSVLSSKDEFATVTPVPLHLTREMEDGPEEKRENLQQHEVHSKKERRKLAGKAKFEAAVARKLVAAISKPVDQKKDKRKKLIDHRFQYMAYFLATMFYSVCFYFCLLLGVTFSKEIERAWLMAFFLAILQDLFISETVVISVTTTVKMVLIPNLAALISGRIAQKYS